LWCSLCIVSPWTIPVHHSSISTSYLTLGETPLELVYQFGYPQSGLLFCYVAILEATCPFYLILFKFYWFKTIHARYINQVWALKQLQLVLYNIETSRLACTLYLYHHGLHAPDTRSLSLILLYGFASWEKVCFGTPILWGTSCARSTNIVNAATQILYLVSIGRCHVPSIFWLGPQWPMIAYQQTEWPFWTGTHIAIICTSRKMQMSCVTISTHGYPLAVT
jgi:hypothetical protein